MRVERTRSALLALFFAGATLGCGAEFDPPTEIKSLRILGVQKDVPYAQAGEDVTFTMLWHDGSPQAGTPERKVQVWWMSGCVNPPGDAYSGCFPQLSARAACYREHLGEADAEDVCGFRVGSGPKFTTRIPKDGEPGLQGAPLLHDSQDPKLDPYGISYVFFALCAGVPDVDAAGRITCEDSAGRALGPDDFVLGYSAIYAFDPSTGFRNNNPVAAGFTRGGDVTDVTCIGDACLGECEDGNCVNRPPDEVDCVTHPNLCLKACPADGDLEDCPPIALRPLVDQAASVEPDAISNQAYGRGFSEQMWIDYYSTAGAFKSATKLLNDATRGYNANNGTEFFAPAKRGPVQIWSVLHDNRGGVSWVGITVQIQ